MARKDPSGYYRYRSQHRGRRLGLDFDELGYKELEAKWEVFDDADIPITDKLPPQWNEDTSQL